MMVTTNGFRVDYPEFASTTLYTNRQISFYLEMAYSFLNADRWGRQLSYGVGLYVAHNLALVARAMATAKTGGIPGQPQGAPVAKKVGPIETRYSNVPSVKDGDDYWNLTTYGVQLLHLIRVMGAGPVQV